MKRTKQDEVSPLERTIAIMASSPGAQRAGKPAAQRAGKPEKNPVDTTDPRSYNQTTTESQRQAANNRESPAMKHYRKPLAHSTNSHLNADRFICVLNLLTTVKYTATQQEDLRFINNALTSCLNAQHDEISRLREIEDFLTWTETDGNPSASNRG